MDDGAAAGCGFIILMIVLYFTLGGCVKGCVRGCSQAVSDVKDSVTTNISDIKDIGTRAGKIKKKIGQLNETKIAIDNKRTKVEQLISEYKDRISTLKSSIKEECLKNGFTGSITYAQVKQNVAIDNSLHLIQHKVAYIEALVEIKKDLDAGFSQVDYYEKLAADDLEMAKTLNASEIKELSGKIGVIVDRYQKNAGSLEIDNKNLRLRPMEDIWSTCLK